MNNKSWFELIKSSRPDNIRREFVPATAHTLLENSDCIFVDSPWKLEIGEPYEMLEN